MRALGALIALPLVLAQADIDRVIDQVNIESEYKEYTLTVDSAATQDGTISDDGNGGKKSTLSFDRTPAQGAPDDEYWTFLKVHFKKFWIPLGAHVEVCGKDRTECYKHEKFDGGRYTTHNIKAGDDSQDRFSSFTIDGSFLTVDVVVPKDVEWIKDVHEVVLWKLDKGASPRLAPAGSTPDREAAKLAICQNNERQNAACRRTQYPTEFKKSYNVARLYVGNSGGMCTTWRVSAGNLMMTNNHCFKEQWELSSSEVHFNYQAANCPSNKLASASTRADAGTVKVKPDRLLRTSAALDYTIYTLTADGFRTINSWSDNQGNRFGYFTLDYSTDPYEGMPIYIPQHGSGHPKQISITDDTDRTDGMCKLNSVQWSRKESRIGYRCDTVGGSSGSPVVLRNSHKVVGLHNMGGCPSYMNGGIKIKHIWPEIQQFFNGAPPAPAPSPPWQPPPAPVSQHCQGYFGSCNANCNRLFHVTKSASNGGQCPPPDAASKAKPCQNGEGDCKIACQPQCGSKQCGDDGCGGSCGSCYSGYTCSTYGTCRYSPPTPPVVNPVDAVPSCYQKTCNYKVSDGPDCPYGYEELNKGTSSGCSGGFDECSYGFAEAIRARLSTGRDRAYDPAKQASSPWHSSRPGGCYVMQYSSSEYLFYSSGAKTGVPSSQMKVVCRRVGFRGPGCKYDRPGAVCRPNCAGVQCGDDGCGGQCQPGCDTAGGETCSANGQCQGPTCSAYASLCAKPGLKLAATASTKRCSKSWSGSWCSEAECCEYRTCAADALCDNRNYRMVSGASSVQCRECTSSGQMNPRSCCVPIRANPAPPACPPDTASKSYCDFIVSLTEKYRQYNFGCLDPEGQYTVKCKTTCKNAGYKVCGEQLTTAISLAAGKEEENEGGSKIKAPWLAAFAGIVALFGACAGVALGRSNGGGALPAELGATSSALSPTQRLDSIEHKPMAGGEIADI
eukprot:Hpha_TRINITY_DN15984_c2_g5::TRINITY_DN15984_c2_g5_i1::g.72854::m.72854